MVVLQASSHIFSEELLSSIRVTIGFLVSSLTKPLLHWLLSLTAKV